MKVIHRVIIITALY